jgi:putative hydrolase of the HAD superfamily
MLLKSSSSYAPLDLDVDPSSAMAMFTTAPQMKTGPTRLRDNSKMLTRQRELSDIKAVIFDYGDVLCLPPTKEEVDASARILNISSDSFRALWHRDRDLYDRGDLSAETYWRRLAEEAGASLASAQLHELSERDVAMWSRLNSGMIAWFEGLSSAGMKTAVLSNMHIEMVRHARQSFKWLERAQCITFSAEVRLIKPDPLIYEHCLGGLGVEPPETLFIDDRQVNIEAARAMGIHAIQFKSMAQLRSEVETAGFPIHMLVEMERVYDRRH